MKKTLALVTDLYYRAQGRDYCREDILLSERLRDEFELVIVHIKDLNMVANHVDAILIRNTGPKSGHMEMLEEIREKRNWPVFNDLFGKGDIQGKHHLLNLFYTGFPVIPTVANTSKLENLGAATKYIIKPLDGCDSQGLKVLQKEPLLRLNPVGFVIQPMIEVDYEVSFYFIGDEFQYALYAPETNRRWELKIYLPDEEDLAFAKRFIRWNSCARGIQRIDACRDSRGKLLLMELEDYNPFLSFEILDDRMKTQFSQRLNSLIKKFIHLTDHCT